MVQFGHEAAADRRDSDYRDYGAAEVHRLAFIRRARDLGFSIAEIRNLPELCGDRERSSADVKALTLTHIEGLEDKIAALKEMRDTPRHLVHECDGDHRPDCPIIGSLEGTVPLPESHHHHKPAENLGHVH